MRKSTYAKSSVGVACVFRKEDFAYFYIIESEFLF